MLDSSCRYCKVPGKQVHLLSESETFTYLRLITLGHPEPPPPYDYLSPARLLGFLWEASILCFTEDLD